MDDVNNRKWSGSPLGLILSMCVLTSLVVISSVDAFCNDEYNKRYPITTTTGSAPFFFVNDSYGLDLGDGIQYIICNQTADYLCYDDSTDYACFNNETKVPTLVSEGNGSHYKTGLDPRIVYFLNGSGDDLSANEITYTVNGSPTITNATGTVGSSIFFDGVDDYHDYGTLTLTNSDITLLIMHRNNGRTTSEYATAYTSGGCTLFIEHRGSGTYDANFRSGGDNLYAPTTSNADDGDWHLLGATVDHSAKTSWAYFDGIQEGTDTEAGYSGSCVNSVFRTGHNPNSGSFKEGNMAFLILLNRTITADEHYALSNNTLASSDGYAPVGALDTAGLISITSPSNTTYTIEPIPLNWTNISAYDTAWYSLNNGSNITLTGDIPLTPVVGSNTLIVYANDSVPDVYDNTVVFTFTPTVDINITTPTNGSYQAPPNVTLQWNYTSARNCNSSLYSVDGDANISSGCGNFTVDISSISSGIHNITLHVNNSLGYADSETVWFTTDSAIVNCSDSGAVESVRFEFYVEDTLAALNGSAEFVIDDIASSYTYNISVVNTTNFSVCIVDPPRIVDMMMLYRASGYEQRTYYFYHAELTSTLQTISLYQITNALGEKLEVNTRDNNDNDVEDVYVAIDRYYPATDDYRTVAIGRSDNTGKFITYIDLDDVFYRFTLSQAGTAVNTYSAMTVTGTSDDPETMVLYIGALETQFFEMISDIGITCDFNETSNNTVCPITDPSGLVVTATLYVQEIGLAGATTICTDTGTGASFTLTCNIPNPEGEYKYFVKVTPTSNPDYVLYQDYIFTATTNPYGVIGLFVSFLFVLGMAGIAIHVHELLGVVLGITFAGLVVSGILTLPWVAVTSLIIMGVLLLYGANRR